LIVKKEPEIIRSYLEDSSNIFGGKAGILYIPENEQEIIAVMKEALGKKMPLTISGGGTGTSGGRVPFGGAVMSMERLNRVIGIFNEDGIAPVISAEAGVTIKDMKIRLAEKALFYTYDPTEQTAFIGGTVGTNASGARSFKYGSTRRSVFGLKAILTDGSYIDVKRGDVIEKDGFLRVTSSNRKTFHIPVPTYKMPMTKTSAGYFASKGMDLIDLFVGSEGTLGCIVEVALKVNKEPDDIISCFAFFKNRDEAYKFAIRARDISNTNKSINKDLLNALSIEYFDKNTVSLIRQVYSKIPEDADACVFFEQDIYGNNDDSVLEKWVGLLKDHNVSLDETLVAMNEKDRQGLLDMRHLLGERMNELTKRNNMPKVTTDLAVPDSKMDDMMDYYMRILHETDMENYLFGHIGNSHLHMNLFPKTNEQYKKAKAISMDFVRKSVSLGGTVSAEHGIGKMRKDYLKELYGTKGIEEMIQVKRALDPDMILCRGNIFDYVEVNRSV